MKTLWINLLCWMVGHKWAPKWHRHDHYYAVNCNRCGITFNERKKK